MKHFRFKRGLGVLLLLVMGSGQVFAQAAEIEIDAGATAWMLTSTALVLLMIPGLAMFYGGLVRTKNVLGTMMHSFAAMGVMSVLWVAFGYSMAFGENIFGPAGIFSGTFLEGSFLEGIFGWNSDYVFLSGIDSTIMEGGVPEYVFAMFQGKFAIITPALIAGAFAERVNFKAYVIFIALWGVLVYNPLCHWVWASDGFLFLDGAIDFAGGTVVHISAGVSGLVAALYLGARRGYPKASMPPSNLVMTMMGVGLLWVGWFGFNAGSSLESALSTAQALTATQVAAGAGALAWMIIEGLHQGKSTALGLASGILAGLVAVTPAAGVVQPMGAMFLGFAASLICYFGLILKEKLGYDDSLDAFGIHGLGGIAGAILLVFFMRDDVNIASQLGIQIFAVAVAAVYAGGVTFVILWVMNKIRPLRSSDYSEMAGMDTTYHGEQGYGMLNPN